jgi:CelD/BcsL family acetyltransferase involved in cellulose biosynthesis
MVGASGSRSVIQPASVCVYHHPDELPAAARLLLDEAERRGVEHGLAWYRTLVDAVFADRSQVFIYVLQRHGRALLVLPLLLERPGRGWQARALSNFYTAVHEPLAASDASDADMAELLNVLRQRHAPLDSLHFAPMDPHSRGYRLLHAGLHRAGFRAYEFFCFGNWFQRIESDWAGYVSGRAGFLRSTIKRMGKKFAAEGGRLQLIVGGAELQAGIAAYEEVYQASWKVPEPFPNFVRSLMQVSAERGWLRLGIAWLNDRPVAAQIWIVAGGKADIYKLAYHEDFKAFAPGTLLTAMLMEQAIDRDGVCEVDYLIGDDEYKRAWMNERRERWGIVAYNPRTARGLQGLVCEIAGRTVKQLIGKLQQRRGGRPPQGSPSVQPTAAS